jgi:hypothetical protein
MPTYMCRWENGDISFVSAVSKDDAIGALDEVGAATAGMLQAVNHFMVHLTLDDDGELELESLGEDTEHPDRAQTTTIAAPLGSLELGCVNRFGSATGSGRRT